MAKSTKSSGTSRIKLIVLDAEVADDQIHTLTQALTNALRGGATPAPRRLAAAAAAQNGHAEPEAEVFEDGDDELDTVDVTPTAPKAKKPRKVAPKPTVIPIPEGDPPLSSLVDPKSNHKRYLMIAAFLHDHRDIQAVTQDHIYSCYRLLGWPTDIMDFAQPLRELKFRQFFESPERGKYAINQLGLQKAKEAD